MRVPAGPLILHQRDGERGKGRRIEYQERSFIFFYGTQLRKEEHAAHKSNMCWSAIERNLPQFFWHIMPSTRRRTVWCMLSSVMVVVDVPARVGRLVLAVE